MTAGSRARGSGSRAGGLLALLALALLLVGGGRAEAVNSRVAISDFRWDRKVVQVDRGEWVTWHWIGPDLMHSVTGDSPNSKQWDSDPQTNQPQHQLGSTFRVTFDAPGSYEFTCKLHTTVRGTIVVSDRPGDPLSDPDPIPQNLLDLEAPVPGELRLARDEFRRRTKLHLALDERGTMEADFYRLSRVGDEVFAGYQEWWAHVGYNDVSFGARSETFAARPGRYVAHFSVTDEAKNSSDPVEIPFRILKPQKPRPKKHGKPKNPGKPKKPGKPGKPKRSAR